MSNITNEDGSFWVGDYYAPKAPIYGRIYFDCSDNKYYMLFPDGKTLDITSFYSVETKNKHQNDHKTRRSKPDKRNRKQDQPDERPGREEEPGKPTGQPQATTRKPIA